MTNPYGSYVGVFNPNIPVMHQVWTGTSTADAHGNTVMTYAPAVEKKVMSVYPVHMLPHDDPVNAEYAARFKAEFIMEVSDASLFAKNDLVTWNNDVFIVQGYPINWGGSDPFGMDKTMFGGSIFMSRVT